MPRERSLRAVCAVLRVLLAPVCARRSRGAGLPESGPLLVAANHLSVVDPVVLALAVLDRGRVPRFLARPSVLEVPVIGVLLRYIGQMPAERGAGDYAVALSEAVDTLRRGECVVIYPEGRLTRRPDLRPDRGRPGAAWLAAVTGARVVPVGHWGAQEVWRFGRTGLVRRRPHRARAVVSFGDPLSVPPLGGDTDLAAVTAEIMAAVAGQVDRAAGRP